MLLLAAGPAFGADYITNGDFSGGTTGWAHVDVTGTTTMGTDNVNFGAASPSLQDLSGPGDRTQYVWYDSQAISTTINSTDTVRLSLWYARAALVSSQAASASISVDILKPSGGAWVTIWSDPNFTFPATATLYTGQVTDSLVSASFDETGIYQIRLYADVTTGRDKPGANAQIQLNWDDIILDVRQPVTNNAPTVTPGATSASPASVNRFGAEATTLSASFSDADQPGVGAFSVTFRVQEPDDATSVEVVPASGDGENGVTIIDDGGGNYTASVAWDPPADAALGDYDLYFEVSDGTDNAIDGYASNNNELTVFSQSAPTVTPGVTAVTPASVNRIGVNTTQLSATWSDADSQPADSFWVIFSVQEPDNITEVLLVDSLTTGNGGLAVTDNGDGTYTATYDWDPGNAQALGAYDLLCRVFDGTTSVEDGYSSNADELSVFSQSAPTITPGVTAVSPASVNRIGANTTELSATWSDADSQPVDSFWVTFSVQEPDNITEVLLVDSLTTGNGGLTVTDNGDGTYTATYSWDPGSGQALGDYDLLCRVFDGTTSAEDGYASNADELTVFSQATPSFTAGATAVTPDSVNRVGTSTTQLSSTWSDPDEQPVDSFWVTISVLEPGDVIEVVLVDSLTTGNGGLTVIDNGDGTYTATYDWDPTGTQALGLYDLRCRVFDGTSAAEDGYAANTDELTVYEAVANNPPTVAPGAPTASPASVNRIGTDSTRLSCQFTDSDQPGEGAFTVTFVVREPDNSTVDTIVSASGNGENGVSITSLGGSSYEATVDWDPPADAALGAYDLHFEVSDGQDSDNDSYANNLDEFSVFSLSAPSITPGVTAVTPDTVNRIGAGTTQLSASWSDADSQPADSFWVTFSVRQPGNNIDTLVDSLTHGVGGLTVVDNGNGTYTATYEWDPGDAQPLGDYDLLCRVFDGTASAEDGYDSNLDELTVISAAIPTLTAGTTTASPASVNRIGTGTTQLSSQFNDVDQPGVGAFTVTFVVREPDNSTVDTIVAASGDGQNGVTITDLLGGDYEATVDWDPVDVAALGTYDLFFDVSDGTGNATDDYADNLDELTVFSESAPNLTPGVTTATPDTVNRAGTNTTQLSATWSDADSQPVDSFWVTFSVRRPGNNIDTLVDSLTHGVGGLTVIDNGNGTYTATYDWDPGDTQPIGDYDLRCNVFDGTTSSEDDYSSNLDELYVEEVLANNAPVVVAGATTASLTSVNRIGANTTTLSAAFSDADIPGVGAFEVTFGVREPDDLTSFNLVSGAGNGQSGVTITDLGSGDYEASVAWDPAANAALGAYDLYFQVTDGQDVGTDDFVNNLDELTVSTQSPPAIAPGATAVSPDSVNRYGTDSTRFSVTWSDPDGPTVSELWVSFVVRYPDDVQILAVADSLTHGQGGMSIIDNGDNTYSATFDWDPSDAQALGFYDLQSIVYDVVASDTDFFFSNYDDLKIYEAIPNRAPVITPGAATAIPSTVNRIGGGLTRIQVDFLDEDDPGNLGFWITLRVREPDNTTQISLVTVSQSGQNGLIVQSLGGGNYRAYYDWNPPFEQTLGAYDIYAMVSDEEVSVEDLYDDNLDELTVQSVSTQIVSLSATRANPDSVNRLGTASTLLRVNFQDWDEDPASAFRVTFKGREPDNATVITVADSLADGESGMSIVDNGDGTYTAQYSWNPDDGATTGLYDLQSEIADNAFEVIDSFPSNPDELKMYSKVANSAPSFAPGAVVASPAGVDRLGADSTRVSIDFTDADGPVVGAFTLTLKVREPDNSSEIVLADHLTNGAGGLVVSDLGGGAYRAYIDWNPPDVQTLGFYDLYALVSDGVDSLADPYVDNLDELTVIEPTTGNAPLLTAGVTLPLPDSLNRTGGSYTILRADFSDADGHGSSTYRVTFKVRDAANAEYTIADSLTSDSTGMSVMSMGSNQFRAEFKWDPADAQALGLYDLYALVEDPTGLQGLDGYTNNTDELELFAQAPAGDGNILHRAATAEGCGSATTACHDIADHQSQTCLVCHTPHSTSNIYLIRDTIQTPASGPMEVIFKTLGIGDPYNDPDPTPGDPTSGVMADSSDGVFTGVCEVCHENTNHHRNDGSQPDTLNHHDAKDCTACHPHEGGFAVSGGGESSGGDGCSCHSSFATPMNTSTTSYHHYIASQNADYTIASKTCLMCHVHHDIFRPDLNTGFGERGKNLRVDITTPVVQGDASVLTNTDYLATGTGGICLSCHTSAQTKSFTPPDGSTSTRAISKTDFDNATSTHNYTASSTFSGPSTFNANCVKCHNDTATKSYQTGNGFSTHDNPYARILNPFSVASPSDPLEEKNCFGCHSTTSNPNAGSNQDYYGVKAMSTAALRIEDVFGYPSGHPTTTVSGVHQSGETGSNLGDGNRHAECADCHDVHGAQVGNPLKGAWGVMPTSWPDPDTNQTDNGNVFTAPSGFTVVNPITEEFQLCLKCHSNYTALPGGARNLAEEINPKYASTHGIADTAVTRNPFCSTATMLSPWDTTGRADCTDCHGSNVSGDPSGPHGSNLDHMLVASIVSNSVDGTPLCFTCHLQTVYWSDRNAGSNSRYLKHPSIQGAHAVASGCFACHMWDHASTAGLGVSTLDWPGGSTSDTSVAPPIATYVHGQNKKWVFNERDGSAGSQDLSDAFVNGYIANIDYSAKDCWAETCKDHSPQNYSK